MCQMQQWTRFWPVALIIVPVALLVIQMALKRVIGLQSAASGMHMRRNKKVLKN